MEGHHWGPTKQNHPPQLRGLQLEDVESAVVHVDGLWGVMVRGEVEWREGGGLRQDVWARSHGQEYQVLVHQRCAPSIG